MADFMYGRALPARNVVWATQADPTPLVHPDLVDHPLITPEVQVALLSFVDETGDATLGDLALAIPDHDRPISAVLALVDAGLLALDVASAFDASCRVWRVSAPRI